MNDNNLFVNQLLADYKFSEKISVNAGVAYNTMRGSEPDRKTNTYGYDYSGSNGQIVGLFPGLNNRYFSTMEENDLTAKAELDFTLNPTGELKKVLTVGGNYRTTDRTFNYIQINYSFLNITPINIDNPEAVFNQQNLDLGRANGGFDLVTLRGTGANAFNPYFYMADRKVAAGYAQLVYPFSEKLTAQVGVRFESFKQKIDWDTYLSSSVNDLTVDPSKIEKTYVLPSINLKYSINEKNALRFAASETYTMPQFKEAAPFLYEDVNFSEFGNPDLVPSTDFNFDLKYDWYLSKKEIISFGTFYKYIQDPISRVRVSSASNDLSYINTSSAFATGVEVEVRKSVYSFEGENRNRDLSFGLNTSFLYTEQEQDDVKSDKLTPSFTHDKGKMQGASPLLINADLSYNTSNQQTALTSTVVFNYAYDKVYSLGTVGLENIVEKSVPTLDFINRFELKKYKLGINLGVKNLLDPKFRLTQETTDLSGQKSETEVNSYRKGLMVSFGLNWTL
ncbi:MAG: TonB-dependent receptor [Flavobacterium sp.]